MDAGMSWSDARAAYPHRWLLVEALAARTEADRRLVERLTVVGEYGDGSAAWEAYSGLHREAPTRELYVVHTDREDLDIRERRELPMRGVRTTQ